MIKSLEPLEELEVELATSTTDRLVFNGINGASGDYLLSPMTLEQMSAFISGVSLELLSGGVYGN